MTERLLCLQHCNLFQRLSPDQLRRIDSRSRSRSFLAHSPIYVPEQKADSVFLLVSGLVKVCHLTADLIKSGVRRGRRSGSGESPDAGDLMPAWGSTPSAVTLILSNEVHVDANEAHVAWEGEGG